MSQEPKPIVIESAVAEKLFKTACGCIVNKVIIMPDGSLDIGVTPCIQHKEKMEEAERTGIPQKGGIVLSPNPDAVPVLVKGMMGIGERRNDLT